MPHIYQYYFDFKIKYNNNNKNITILQQWFATGVTREHLAWYAEGLALIRDKHKHQQVAH